MKVKSLIKRRFITLHHNNLVDGFTKLAKEKFGYSKDQAHALLYWHNLNISRAAKDLEVFTPRPSMWNQEEEECFEIAVKVSNII